MILNNSYAFKMLLARFSTNTLVTRITQKKSCINEKREKKETKEFSLSYEKKRKERKDFSKPKRKER